jgi:hypothetical protein
MALLCRKVLESLLFENHESVTLCRTLETLVKPAS